MHAAICLRHPDRFVVFPGVDPRWGRDGLELFERAIRDLGFAGLKIYPPCGYRPDDPALFPFYEICAQRRLPVLVHLGPTSSTLSFATARPEFVDEPARQFPTVPFILAHAATAFTHECASLCAFRPNVYADLSGFQHALNHGGADGVSALLRSGISHKLLFGTAWPIFRTSGCQSRDLNRLRTLANDELGNAQLSLILGGNAERLLWPIASLSLKRDPQLGPGVALQASPLAGWGNAKA